MRNITTLAAVSLAALCAACPLARAEEHKSTIEVTGSGSVEVNPDRVNVSIGVEKRADTTLDAQKLVNEAINGTLDAVRALSIDGLELKTTRLRLDPVYSREEGKDPELLGYEAQRRVKITMTDLSRVGAVIDAAIQGGINDLDGVYFSIADEQPHKLAALKSATRNAKMKAEAMAESLGMRLGDVVVARDSQDRWGGVSPFQSAREPDAKVDPEPVEIEAEVTIVWELVE